MRPAPVDELSVEVQQDEIDGRSSAIPIRRYLPSGPRDVDHPRATFVWVHGGGFFRGDVDLPEAHRVSLAIAARGIPVVSVGYRLVPPPGMAWARRPGRPSVRFPLPMQDVLDVMHHVSRETDARFIVGGASAGACLVSSALIEGAPAGLAPLGAVLAYGFFHARTPIVPEIQRLVRGHRRLTHSRLALDLANRNYAGSATVWKDGRTFPGGNDLRGFPPTLMVDAERDSMRASAELFARELVDAGVSLDRQVLSTARHAFLNRPSDPEFKKGVDLIVDWMASRASR